MIKRTYYDLLASEARLASLLAIAKGDVPERHWLCLGRPKGSKNKQRVLDPFKYEILTYLQQGLNIDSIMKLINPKLKKPATYNTFRYYVRHENELRRAWAKK